MPRIAHDRVQVGNLRRVSITRNPVEEILALHKRDATSRPVALAAKCCQCKTDQCAIRGCDERGCALWLLRPFQRDTEPRPAPHCVSPLTEVLDGLEPGESER